MQSEASLLCMSYAEVQPDFAESNVSANRMQSDELALKSYAEVQPDFAEGNGISARGKVNEVNDTPGSPPTTAFKWYRAL